MGRAVVAACVRTPAEGVRDAVRERIGDDRFGVWFADASWTLPTNGKPGIVVRAGTGVTHEWLRRTFHADVAAAAHAVCGAGACVEWESAENPTPSPRPDAPPARSSTGRRPRRGGAPAAVTAAPTIMAAEGEPAPTAPLVASRRPHRALREFIVGPCNRMAFAAVEIAASRPGEMSPLVIHGPTGSGKSHLLELVCSRGRGFHPAMQAVHLSAEQFTTSFLQALHGRGLPGFRRSIRSADLLAIDDVQFFVGKRATIQEFQQTIDAFQRLGKQVVVSCDRDLDGLGDLGGDLVGRLRGGMTARLLPPDYDVRRGIVTTIARSRGLEMPDEVIHHVATHMTRHARELAGAVNRLEATSHMLGLPLTLDLAEEALSDLVRSSSRCLRLADIERAVCTAFGIDAGGLQSNRRSRTVSHPRMLAMFLARKHTRAALAEIGGHFGGRSHSTVVTAQKSVTSWLVDKKPIVLGGVAWDVAEAIRHVEDMLRAS